MGKVKVSIAGASGYSGGEALRLLLGHPGVDVVQVTSERLAGQPVVVAHPNLRGRTGLRFTRLDELTPVDALFLCLPHGESSRRMKELAGLAAKLVDLSADFRLKDLAAYEKWYGQVHPCPERLGEFVYGIPELHRPELANARGAAAAGCNATASILALHPLYAAGVARQRETVIEVKAGSSEGGAASSEASHHPERANCIRSYKPAGHRHQAEIRQELGLDPAVPLHFSATAVDLVRGLLVTAHVFPDRRLEEKDVWRIYRQAYAGEPFIRLVKSREGICRFPEPKLLWGTNYCDIGFELDPDTGRLVVLAAIDNLMKGSAGQAVQCFNLMHGFAENTALDFPGLHPV